MSNKELSWCSKWLHTAWSNHGATLQVKGGCVRCCVPGLQVYQLCLEIQTTDDMLLEIPESFSVEVNVSSLMNFDTVINMASVMILDNDGKY